MSKSSRSSRTDGEATRARILETAGRLFAQTGFAETTSKAIATEAEVDLASINYHFGSRNGLYQAVLAEAHRRIINLLDLQEIAERGISAEEKLRALFTLLIDAAQAERGWNYRVLARELLAPSSNLLIVFSEELLPKLGVTLGILSELTAIPDGDPALLRCLVSTGAPFLMLLVASNDLPGPALQVRHMPKKELIEHLHCFALAGLRATSTNYHGGDGRA